MNDPRMGFGLCLRLGMNDRGMGFALCVRLAGE